LFNKNKKEEEMSENEFFKEYMRFVDDVTSDFSKNDELQTEKRLNLSKALDGQFSRLDMAVAGIAGESGEINDVWKKLKFQGVEWDELHRERMINELGDMYWYLMQASIAIGVSPEEIIKKNQEKLLKRHGSRNFNAKEYVDKEFRKHGHILSKS
jgi:NTP pyrophosphatase (non-canonical NTP hydrolase)